MPKIGMRHPVAATITTQTAGSAITYGTGKVLGKAVAATINWKRNSNDLYGDDVRQETDNSVIGYDIELETTDLTADVRAYLLGEIADTTTTTLYDITDDAAPNVGFGFITVIQRGTTKTFEGHWFHKCRFGMNSEAAATKGESIQWQTPKLQATGDGVYIDATGKAKFAQHQEFASEALALTWLNGKANIT